jgi:hypothetical protein
MASHVCAACGREMRRYEGYASDMGYLCHPDDPTLRDCYHRWTVYQDDGSCSYEERRRHLLDDVIAEFGIDLQEI